MPLRKPAKKSSNTASRISKARLAAMIEEATVDAYGDSEQTTGWYTMLEEHLAAELERRVEGHARTKGEGQSDVLDGGMNPLMIWTIRLKSTGAMLDGGRTKGEQK